MIWCSLIHPLPSYKLKNSHASFGILFIDCDCLHWWLIETEIKSERREETITFAATFLNFTLEMKTVHRQSRGILTSACMWIRILFVNDHEQFTLFWIRIFDASIDLLSNIALNSPQSNCCERNIAQSIRTNDWSEVMRKRKWSATPSFGMFSSSTLI